MALGRPGIHPGSITFPSWSSCPPSVAVRLPDCTVYFYADGVAWVDVLGLKTCGYYLSGRVWFRQDGSLWDVAVRLEGNHSSPPAPRVLKAAGNLAGKKMRYARRVARQILSGNKRPPHYEPGTLEHLVLRAEGKIREDGWPYGWIPL